MKLAEYRLKTPLKREDVERLRIGDVVYLTGEIYSARDEAHKRLLQLAEKGGKPPVNLDGAAIYHMGPIVEGGRGKWKVLAAGPTTSFRMERLTPSLLEHYPIRMIIGKGGMGDATSKALAKRKAVYCHHPGGVAVLAADKIKRVVGVKWLDLGVPEALWILEVETFGPLLVTMDSRGESLHRQLKAAFQRNLERLLAEL